MILSPDPKPRFSALLPQMANTGESFFQLGMCDDSTEIERTPDDKKPEPESGTKKLLGSIFGHSAIKNLFSTQKVTRGLSHSVIYGPPVEQFNESFAMDRSFRNSEIAVLDFTQNQIITEDIDMEDKMEKPFRNANEFEPEPENEKMKARNLSDEKESDEYFFE